MFIEHKMKVETIKDYLIDLLDSLWDEKECFNGKRPFGNSGWQFDIFAALVEADIINGKIDEDGNLEECNNDLGEQLISQAIQSLRN